MVKTFFFPQIDIMQLDSLLKHSPTAVLGNFFLGAANVAVFWPSLDHQWLLIWSAFLFLVMVFRILLAFKYKHADKALISCATWHRWFVISSLIQGLCWMALGMYAVVNLEPTQLTILFVSTAGLIGGSIATTSSSVQAFISFSAPSLFPVVFMMFYSEQATAKVLGLLAVFYFTLTVRSAFDINAIMLESIRNNKELQGAKKRAEMLADELYKLSTQDALTQIANRRGFDETLEKEWRRASRKNTGLSLLMIDVDHFKNFNDHYGHPMGDEALKQVALLLKQQATRITDYVARYGGEEFAIILVDTNADEAIKIANKVCRAVQLAAIEHKDSPISDFLTVSVGVAHLKSDQTRPSLELVTLADRNLYEAKAGGRNCVVG
ncbi:MAG: GGDEF domain-containing protein [Bermanella sp.]